MNSVTHMPVARALVYSADDRFAMMTDSDGQFEFTLPKEGEDLRVPGAYARTTRSYLRGRLRLMARRPGFLEDSGELPPALGVPGKDVTIALVPEGLIIGRVSLSTNEAANGVNVQLFTKQVIEGLPRWTVAATVLTNSAGEFRFAELSAGSYRLVTHEFMDNDPVATAPGGPVFGFPPVYFPGAADFSGAASIELTAGETVEASLALTRQPYYHVRIPVAAGDVQGGMNVSVQGVRGQGYALGYNAGQRRIEGPLPTGNYVVSATMFSSEKRSSGKVNLVVAGKDTDGPLMALAPNISIAVNVKEEFSDTKWNGDSTWSDGKRTIRLRGPRVYLQVGIEDAEDFGGQHAASFRPPTGQGDDPMILDNVAPGRYWLRLNTSRGYVASATMGTVDLLREPLVVGTGTSSPIEITMRDDEAELEGTVATIAEQAKTADAASSEDTYQQIWVYCVPLPDSTGRFHQMEVTADGKFNDVSLAPGSYRILAFADRRPNLPYRDAEAMKKYEMKGPTVTLVAGQKTTVQVPLATDSE